jgi:hypothetical protein
MFLLRPLPLMVLAACAVPTALAPPSAVPSTATLDVSAQLVRASLSLRGHRPSAAEIADARTHPERLQDMVASFAQTEAFVEVMADLHAERWRVRVDTRSALPPRGPLQGVAAGEIQRAITEGPLEMVRQLVREGRPYTDLVTSEEVRTNAVLAELYGLEHDPAGPEWQWARFEDGRPAAGVLSDNGLWMRHLSADTNKGRLRAAVFADALLCVDLVGRGVPVVPGADLTDAGAVADAVRDVPACVACHQTLDPLAAHFHGFRRYVLPYEVRAAYDRGCEGDERDSCYPITFYNPSNERLWEDEGLRPPSYFGLASDGLADLGAHVAADPRFAECTVRTLYSWFAQTEREHIPHDVVAPLTASFVGGGFDLRELAANIVGSSAFLASGTGIGEDFVVGALSLRPEQLDTTLQALAGFRWQADLDALDCAEDDSCFGAIDLLRSDRVGFHTLGGGTDGYDVVRPSFVPSPDRLLVTREVALEAARALVERELSSPPSQRVLLPLADEEDAVEEQLGLLHHALLGEAHRPGSAGLQPALVLFEGVAQATGKRDEAWVHVLAGLLSDPAMVLY